VLDRLIDRKPTVSSEPEVLRTVRLARLKESVHDDLQWLLNCKRSIVKIPTDLKHLRGSLLTFGLPDFTHASLTRAEDHRALQRNIVTAIRMFEPRLKEVVVTVAEGREFDRSLRFRIEAKLDVKPVSEPVVFDSVLDLATKSFSLEVG
jgi:type VI secretion system protein ImpF